MDCIKKRLHTNHQRVQLMSLELLEYLVSVSSNQEVLNELETDSFLKIMLSLAANSMFFEVNSTGAK